MKTLIKQIALVGFILSITMAVTETAAYTIYKAGQTPYDYQQKGNYGASNPYNQASTNYPYNNFNNPYSPEYVNNNPRYCTQIYNHNGGLEGILCTNMAVSGSINNPYNSKGNPYNTQNYFHPYNTNNPANPYNEVNSIYSPNSYYNSNKYQTPGYKSNGP